MKDQASKLRKLNERIKSVETNAKVVAAKSPHKKGSNQASVPSIKASQMKKAKRVASKPRLSNLSQRSSSRGHPPKGNNMKNSFEMKLDR